MVQRHLIAMSFVVHVDAEGDYLVEGGSSMSRRRKFTPLEQQIMDRGKAYSIFINLENLTAEIVDCEKERQKLKA